MSVEVICAKSFSQVDMEIIDKFVELQDALIEKDLDKLNDIVLDDFELGNMFAKKQSKSEFIAMVEDNTFECSKSDIMEPTILWDDENTASLIADVRLTAKIHGNERRWISKSVVNFKKTGEKWCICSWDN